MLKRRSCGNLGKTTIENTLLWNPRSRKGTDSSKTRRILVLAGCEARIYWYLKESIHVYWISIWLDVKITLENTILKISSVDRTVSDSSRSDFRSGKHSPKRDFSRSHIHRQKWGQSERILRVRVLNFLNNDWLAARDNSLNELAVISMFEIGCPGTREGNRNNGQHSSRRAGRTSSNWMSWFEIGAEVILSFFNAGVFWKIFGSTWSASNISNISNSSNGRGHFSSAIRATKRQ